MWGLKKVFAAAIATTMGLGLVVPSQHVRAQSAPAVSTFRTKVDPRVDPVFGDVTALRGSVDRFLSLEGQMVGAREQFSTAVHGTLALIGALGTTTPAATSRAAIKVKSKAARTCPAGVDGQYRVALEAGNRYLSLGHNLEARFREIRRADQGGDAVGLTPDYRAKIRRVHDLYLSLLRDLREMRLAFHDQLGAEMLYVGCRPGGTAVPVAEGTVDIADPKAWTLDNPAEDPLPDVAADARPAAEAPGGPSVWIEVDNSRCNEASRLTIDGVVFGEIPPGKKIPVRARSGPRSLCLLPSSGTELCGAQGTLRRTYVYEGLTLAVRCAR